MLDILEKIFSITTGILTVGIAIWVVFVGQSQFRANLKISEEQLKLSKTEREQAIESGIPILAISTSGFTPIFDSNYYEYVFKLQNYGDRPAYNIRIELYAIVYNNDNRPSIIDRFDEIAANPMTKNMQWDVGRSFKTSIKTKIFIFTKIEYQDTITKKKRNESYLLFIPEFKYLKNKKGSGLSNASLAEKDSIEKYINSLVK